MKATLARWFLWASVLFSGTLFGGALYEQLVIQPMWSRAAPKSLEFMTNPQYPVIQGLGPFYMLTPAMLLATIGAAITTWRSGRQRPSLIAAVGAISVVAFTFAYFIPRLLVFFGSNGEGYAGGRDAEIAAMAQQWVLWNWARLALVLTTFVASAAALSTAVIRSCSRPIAIRTHRRRCSTKRSATSAASSVIASGRSRGATGSSSMPAAVGTRSSGRNRTSTSCAIQRSAWLAGTGSRF